MGSRNGNAQVLWACGARHAVNIDWLVGDGEELAGDEAGGEGGEAGIVAEGVEAGDSLGARGVVDANWDGVDTKAGPEGAGEDFDFETVADGTHWELEAGGEWVDAEAG